jgi:thiamine biosynthesis lipoprotein
MASPCELLVEAVDAITANRLASITFQEAKRIEQKFSRYRDDNIVYQINHAQGKTIEVDDETALLLNFADQCYQLSDGLFDITSGVLRKVWTFDGSDRTPTNKQIKAVLPLVGWQKVSWQPPFLTLPPEMEIDFGGIGKEYAVDQTCQRIQQEVKMGFLVNFGGDLCASGIRKGNKPWLIGLENPIHTDKAQGAIEIKHGALATSGDTKRYLLKNGKRYAHILNPKTGWPVEHAPRSITVAASTTVEAGMLASFALLQGSNAKSFLVKQKAQHWILV